MALNLEQLNKFDLEKKLETTLISDPTRHGQLAKFLQTVFEIQVEDRFIRDCPSFPQSTQDIFEKELASAVSATLAIEGTMLSEDEIETSFKKADSQKALADKEREASNTRDTYKHVIDMVKQRKKNDFVYEENDIKNIHEHLTNHIECISPNVPGRYRDLKASFGYPRKFSLCETKGDIEMTMRNLIKWLNEKNSGILSSNPLVKAIMTHYYLAEIHPFGDGNGRTARAAEALVLYANGVNTYCFWALANFWNSNRDKYLTYLGNIKDTCDPWEFLVWGAQGYLDEIKRIKNEVLTKIRKLMLQDYIRWLLHKKRISKRICEVLMVLIDMGKTPLKQFVSSPQISALYFNRKESTRYKDFNKMETVLELIKISKEDNQKSIEPNFQKLDQLLYTP